METGSIYEEQKMKVSIKRAKGLRHNSVYRNRETEPWDGKKLKRAEEALERLGYGNVIAGLDEHLSEPA